MLVNDANQRALGDTMVLDEEFRRRAKYLQLMLIFFVTSMVLNIVDVSIPSIASTDLGANIFYPAMMGSSIIAITCLAKATEELNPIDNYCYNIRGDQEIKLNDLLDIEIYLDNYSNLEKARMNNEFLEYLENSLAEITFDNTTLSNKNATIVNIMNLIDSNFLTNINQATHIEVLNPLIQQSHDIPFIDIEAPAMSRTQSPSSTYLNQEMVPFAKQIAPHTLTNSIDI